MIVARYHLLGVKVSYKPRKSVAYTPLYVQDDVMFFLPVPRMLFQSYFTIMKW